MDRQNNLRYRIAPLEMSPSEFRKAGYHVVDEIAEFLYSLPDRPVTPHESPVKVREALGTDFLPSDGMETRQLLEDTAHLLFDHSLFNGHPPQNLSITTFRYVPRDLHLELDEVETYLNQLNAEILTRIQKSGEAFISNAVIHDTFLLRACIVNFRTSLEDIEALTNLVMRTGRQLDALLRPDEL